MKDLRLNIAFDNNSVDYIYIDNTLEHLDSPLKVMEEIYRILKPGSGVKVIVPYFRSHSAFTDPTHTKFFTTESFTYYDSDHVIAKRYDYTLAKFKTDKIIFHENLNSGFIKKFISAFANKYPKKYETYLSHLIPLDEITFDLIKM